MAFTVEVDGKKRVIGKALDPLVKQAEAATAEVKAMIEEVEDRKAKVSKWFKDMLAMIDGLSADCLREGKQVQDRVRYLKNVEDSMKAIATHYEKLNKLSEADRKKKIAEIDKRLADEEKRAMALLSAIIDESAAFEKSTNEARMRLKMVKASM